MPDLAALDEPTFVNLEALRLALVKATRSLPKSTPPHLVDLLDDTIAGSAIPPRLVALVRAIWNAETKAPDQLKVVGARVADWLSEKRQGDLGKSGEALRIRLAFMRELGVEGSWPDPSDDPARGEPAA